MDHSKKNEMSKNIEISRQYTDEFRKTVNELIRFFKSKHTSNDVIINSGISKMRMLLEYISSEFLLLQVGGSLLTMKEAIMNDDEDAIVERIKKTILETSKSDYEKIYLSMVLDTWRRLNADEKEQIKIYVRKLLALYMKQQVLQVLY